MFGEWRRQEAQYFKTLLGGNTFQCPACQDKPHIVYLDGNMKLYRYEKKSRD